jgi:hypothetical protein
LTAPEAASKFGSKQLPAQHGNSPGSFARVLPSRPVVSKDPANRRCSRSFEKRWFFAREPFPAHNINSGGGMISPEFSFEQFFKSVSGKRAEEIIVLAEREATKVWRQSHHLHLADPGQTRPLTYHSELIGLIRYMRSNVKPTKPKDELTLLYQHLGKNRPSGR